MNEAMPTMNQSKISTATNSPSNLKVNQNWDSLVHYLRECESTSKDLHTQILKLCLSFHIYIFKTIDLLFPFLII